MGVETESNNQNLYALRFVIAAVMVLLAAVPRILPHPWIFAPVRAMATFPGSLFRDRWVEFLLPLKALFAGDLFVGLYKLMFIVYLSFALSIVMGLWLARSRTVVGIGGAVFFGALQFLLNT